MSGRAGDGPGVHATYVSVPAAAIARGTARTAWILLLEGHRTDRNCTLR